MSGSSQRSLRQRDLGRLVAAALLLAGSMILAGCSASTVADHTPTALGGLPEGVPQRPTKPPAYPAVHDMPPARDSAVLSDAEQTKLEADLAKARDRLGAQSGPADKPAGGAPNP